MTEPLRVRRMPLSSRKRKLLDRALQREGIHVPGVPPIERRTSDAPPPLSFAQQRLWFLDQWKPGTASFTIPQAVRLDGPLAVSALRGAWQEIVRRHEILRTTLRSIDGRPVQHIAPPGAAPMPAIDLTGLPAAARLTAARDLTAIESGRGFSLGDGPLWRVRLLRLAADDHVLIVVLHHVASDGWSAGILLRELAQLYDAIGARRPSPLAALPVQYADYAVWQRQWLTGATLDAQLGYWTRQLGGLEPLALPIDRPRPPVVRHRAAQVTFALDPALSAAIRDLARREGVTLFMLLLAAFQVALARWTGQADVAVATITAGRRRPELEGVIGVFVNQLVLRTDLTGAPTFRTVLDRVRAVTLGAYAHQDLPFEGLVDALAPPRTAGRAPLAQVMLVLQNTPAPSFAATSSGLTLRDWDAPAPMDPADLTMFVSDARGAIAGDLDYATDLFHRSTIARVLALWTRTLERVVAAPETCIDEIPLLGDRDRHVLVDRWNATAIDHGPARCVHELVAAQAARTPSSIAIVASGTTLTYAALDARARRLAHHLRRLGVGPDARVGICLERGLDVVVAVLGVLQAGGAYVPLDPDYPAERLAFMRSDAALAALITREDVPHARAMAPGACPVVWLDREAPLIGAWPAVAPDTGVMPDHAAAVIYTSGSTGVPKGVVVTHRGLHNLLLWMDATYGMTAGDRVLQKTPLGFDVSTWEMFWPLMRGAVVVMARPGGHRDPAYLAEVIAAERITTIHFVPSLLRAFVLGGGLSRCGTLRRLFSGGEALDATLRDACLRAWPGELHNRYGPTEATVNATAWHCRRDDHGPNVPIGAPIANARVYVCDTAGEIVPIGVPAELYLGGAPVARGYLHRPGLTAERFVPDPFSGEAGARLYRTGDLARWREDGVLVYVGRTDQQVKIRGYRVELGEIDAVMRTHPDVHEAVVVCRDDEQGGRELVGYWAGRPAGDLDHVALRAYLRAQLPEHMVPRALIRCPELPRTPSGKIDRRALPAPEITPASHEPVAPGTREEALLCGIWAQVLRRDRVGIEDNFFDLGGDSILSIQIVARAAQAGLAVTVQQIFTHQTIAALAAVVEPARITAPQGPMAGPVPLTPIQHAWLERQPVVPSHFNQSVIVALRQRVSPGVLRAAFEAIVVHHDALRLRFERTAAAWTQTHADLPHAPVFAAIDLAALPAPAQRAAIERLAARLQRSLDLSHGPLIRAAYIALGAAPARLLVIIHHAVVDGVSWRILLEDLEVACAQMARGEAVRLPPKTTPFQQWARALVAYAARPEVQAERAWWLQAASATATLPRDAGAPPERAAPIGRPTVAGAVSQVRVDVTAAETRALLEDAPRVHGGTIQAVLLTALVSALGETTGLWRWRIDLEGHGREAIAPDLDVSRTVGWFTTRYPLVLEAAPATALAARVRAVEAQMRSLPVHGIGYGVLRYLAGDRGLAGSPADLTFNYLGQLDQALDGLFAAAPESSGPVQDAREIRPYPIEIDAAVVDGRLQSTWRFSGARHDAGTIAGIAGAFAGQLRALAASADRPASGAPRAADLVDVDLSEQELERLLARIQSPPSERASPSTP